MPNRKLLFFAATVAGLSFLYFHFLQPPGHPVTLRGDWVKEDFQITCDLKLINIVAGTQSCTSLYSCPYCEGSKVALESGKATTGRGKWVAGELRTFKSIEEHQKRWENETNSNRKSM